MDRYAPGGPVAKRLAGIERAPVRAAASARLVQSQAATVAPAAVRGEAAVPVSAPVRAAAATCFPSPRGTARRSVSPVGTGRGGGTSRGAAPAAMFGSMRTSDGPPISTRCSRLSRRIRTSLRRPSTLAASTTASRAWRPRRPAFVGRSRPNHRTGFKQPFRQSHRTKNHEQSYRHRWHLP